MKKFTKLFLSCAAVAALTGAVASSAMAANELTATYDAEAGTITIGDYTDVANDDTLLVLKPGADDTAVKDSDIVQIDQQADAFKTVVVGTLEDGTYTVKIGGDGNIYTGTFTVGSQSTTHDVLMGDVNEDKEINSTDALQVMRYEAGLSNVVNTADREIASDVNADKEINSTDALQVMRYEAGLSTNSNVGKTASVDENGTVVEYK